MKPFKPPPAIATNVLIGVCVAVQAAVLVLGPRFGDTLVIGWGLVPARIMAMFHGAVPAIPAALTLMTALFLHGGLTHLALNMVFLAWVGRYVEWVVGRGGAGAAVLRRRHRRRAGTGRCHAGVDRTGGRRKRGDRPPSSARTPCCSRAAGRALGAFLALRYRRRR